ncbi:hypothetical protein V7S43_014724 [Phytophthora oleae]|uniref:WW domain-containing protein n=1 Tax=Phytophthora oleae TaxID=2107226 RepID=A0ABD3F070_9STRA
MASRGVNGAASGTLNERFIKCAGCRVNVPKEDMLALGKCTVCGRVYEPVVTEDGRGIEVATVAFDGTGAAPATTAENKPKRKRWAVLTSKRGKTYYHNTETGEDRWDKPADLEADAAEDAFVPFKNDAVKKAVLREQMKLEATKMGVPMEMVAVQQEQLQQEDEADDPFSKMVGKPKSTDSPPVQANNPKQKATAPSSAMVEEEEDEEDEPAQQPQEVRTGGSCAIM